MPEIGTSGLMSGEGKRSVAHKRRHRASSRLYSLIRATVPNSAAPAVPFHPFILIDKSDKTDYPLFPQ
jgi:hypothetical protein